MKRNLLISLVLLLTLVAIVIANTYSGGVSGTATGNALLKSTGDRSVGGSSASDDGTTFTINTNKVLITESNGNTTIAGTLAVTGATVHTGTVNGPFGAVRQLTTPVVLTAAQSGQLEVVASTADAVTTFTLPAASTAGLRYCFAADVVTGSNREIDIEPPGAADLIVGTTTPAGGTGIATTAGAGHGIKNTHATAVRGNSVCLQSDGTNTWYMTSLSGIWAAY